MPGFFDTFTADEATLMETIIGELKDVPWAEPLLREITLNGGLRGENMNWFFELRQGYALHKAGITPQYEVPGEGQSTLDFGFTSNGQRWNIELMRLQETEAVKAATTTGVDERGTVWKRRILSSTNEDPSNRARAKLSRRSSASVRNAKRAENPTKILAS